MKQEITELMIRDETSYRVIGRSASDGRIYHVSSDFDSLSSAMTYRKNYCGKCQNDKDDTFAIIKLNAELMYV